MKRHRTLFISACALLAFAVPSFAQPAPFQKYIFDVREHRQSSELLAFGKECGITAPTPEQQRFAIGQDGWHPAKDLAKQVDKADSEFLATAEIWMVDGKSRMVITWSTNAEGAQEQLSCIDSAEKVTRQRINSWSTEGSGFDEIIINKDLNPAGELVQKSAELIPNHGERKPLSATSLKNELYQYAAKYPDNRSLSDYQFPAILFKPVKPGKR
jgi:hypothetical protein